MLSAFLIALREGVEASLVVGIVLVYLARTGRAQLSRYVWGGVAAAVALSLAVAIALDRFNISEDGFEGLMYLAAAFFVVTMIWWMNSVAKHLKKEIEEKVEKYAGRGGSAAGWGIGLFVFLMVLREGAELALILRAVEMSTEGLQTWIGTVLGIAAAVAVGLFFFKGTLKVPLHRFFAVTSSILILVAIQLAVTGLHELSEARWIPSSKTEMAILGPIVRNELFFFIFVFGAVVVMIFREWQNATQAKAPAGPMNEAERRLDGSEKSPTAALDDGRCGCEPGGNSGAYRGFHLRQGKFGAATGAAGASGERPCADSGVGSAGREYALVHIADSGAIDTIHGHQETEWVRHGAGRLPDLRRGGLPARGTERDLPALRLGDLYSDDRTEGRVQSHRIPLASARGRHRN